MDAAQQRAVDIYSPSRNNNNDDYHHPPVHNSNNEPTPTTDASSFVFAGVPEDPNLCDRIAGILSGLESEAAAETLAGLDFDSDFGFVETGLLDFEPGPDAPLFDCESLASGPPGWWWPRDTLRFDASDEATEPPSEALAYRADAKPPRKRKQSSTTTPRKRGRTPGCAPKRRKRSAQRPKTSAATVAQVQNRKVTTCARCGGIARMRCLNCNKLLLARTDMTPTINAIKHFRRTCRGHWRTEGDRNQLARCLDAVDDDDGNGQVPERRAIRDKPLRRLMVLRSLRWIEELPCPCGGSDPDVAIACSQPPIEKPVGNPCSGGGGGCLFFFFI
jgi:hypothetical protein